MSTPPKIRAAEATDVPAIAMLLEALNQHENIAASSDPQALASALFGPAREVAFNGLVAVQDKTIVAVLLYYPGYDTLSASYGYHLADMVVAKTHRRRAIGRGLFKALADQALGEGKEWVSLTMLKNNNSARLFYASLGMSQVEVDFFAIGKTGLAGI